MKNDSQKTTHNIFVYGTLRSKGWNNDLLRGSQLVSPAVTENKYALYVANIPYVVKDKEVSRIVGEVWSVDGDTLARLDRLEGHPDWYKREEVNVLTEDNKPMRAWLYFNPTGGGALVESGDYFNHLKLST